MSYKPDHQSHDRWALVWALVLILTTFFWLLSLNWGSLT